jgi:hypothetical protein
MSTAPNLPVNTKSCSQTGGRSTGTQVTGRGRRLHFRIDAS